MIKPQKYKVAGSWVMLAALFSGGTVGYCYAWASMVKGDPVLRNEDTGQEVRARKRSATSPAPYGLTPVASYLTWLPESLLRQRLKNFEDIATEGIGAGGGMFFEHAVALLTLDSIAKEEPWHVFDLLFEERNLHLRTDQVRIVMERWFEQDPHGLASRVEGIPRGEDGDIVRQEYLELLMKESPAIALEKFGEEGYRVKQGAYYQLFDNWGKKDRAEAQTALKNIGDPDRKAEAGVGIARSWAVDDFQGAWKWVDSENLVGRSQIFMELCSDASKADKDFIFNRLESMSGDDAKGILLGGGPSLVRLDAERYYEKIEAVLRGDALKAAVMNTCAEVLRDNPTLVTAVYERTSVGELRDKMAIGVYDAWKDIDRIKATEWFRGVDLPGETIEERIALPLEEVILWGE